MSNTLFSQFSGSSKEEWLAKVEKDLKGKVLESLNWEINEDWTVSPFAHAEDWTEKISPLVQAGKTNNIWEIGEQILVKDVKIANKTALEALENGVNALLLELTHQFTVEEFESLFKDIQLEWISIHFKSDEIKNRSRFLSFLSYSPVTLNLIDKLKGSWRSNQIDFTRSNNLTNFKFLHIDGIPFYKNTANTIQELTQIIQALNRSLQQIDAEQVQQIHLSIAVGKSYFINIAKIRALKLLWQNLLSAYGLDVNTPLPLEAHLAPTSFTEDQYQNMIKASTQALSAVIAGVNRLFIAPADGKENPFTKRIARNVQHLLQLESHLDHVVDPAAGSYYVEQLTQEIAERAWSDFTKNS